MDGGNDGGAQQSLSKKYRDPVCELPDLMSSDQVDRSDSQEFDVISDGVEVASISEHDRTLSSDSDSEAGEYFHSKPQSHKLINYSRQTNSQPTQVQPSEIKYLCKHCDYATMSYSNITCHFVYVHPGITVYGELPQHYRMVCKRRRVRKVPFLYFCQYCNYITLNRTRYILHSRKFHAKRKANPSKQGSSVTTGANRKYLEALCLAKEEPTKSKVKARRLLSVYHPSSAVLQTQKMSCMVCKKLFLDSRSLVEHYESQHPRDGTGIDEVAENFKCQMCDWTCPTQLGLHEHYTESHLTDLDESSHTPDSHSVLRIKRRKRTKTYDRDSLHDYLDKVDASLLSVLNYFGNASECHISTYHIPCVACDFSTVNLLSLLNHYKQYHDDCYPKKFALFLLGKFRIHVKTILVSPSTAKYIEAEDGGWLIDNHGILQCYQYRCRICGFKCDWLAQMLAHHKVEHSHTQFSLHNVQRSRASPSDSTYSSFLQCSICYRVVFTGVEMAMHYREVHSQHSYQSEMVLISMEEMKSCDHCDFVGNLDALQWHYLDKHNISKMDWSSLAEATKVKYENVRCCVCKYTPSDDMDLIAHYQKRHAAESTTFTYSSVDNLYSCLLCRSEMVSLREITSHCDRCLSAKPEESNKKRVRYSTCVDCSQVFKRRTPDSTIWRHVVQHHCGNTIPFNVYDLEPHTLRYGFWDVGDTNFVIPNLPASIDELNYSPDSQSSENQNYASSEESYRCDSAEEKITIKNVRGASADSSSNEDTKKRSPVVALYDLKNDNALNKKIYKHVSNGVNISSQYRCSRAGVDSEAQNAPRVTGFNHFNTGEDIESVNVCKGEPVTPSKPGEDCFLKVRKLKLENDSTVVTLSPDDCATDSLRVNMDLKVLSSSNGVESVKTEPAEVQEEPGKCFVICKFCLEGSVQREEFERHIARDHGVSLGVRCFGCNATFADRSRCVWHHKHIHGVELNVGTVLNFLLEDIGRGEDGNYVCLWCGFTSSTKFTVLNHLNVKHVMSATENSQFENGSHIKFGASKRAHVQSRAMKRAYIESRAKVHAHTESGVTMRTRGMESDRQNLISSPSLRSRTQAVPNAYSSDSSDNDLEFTAKSCYRDLEKSEASPKISFVLSRECGCGTEAGEIRDCGAQRPYLCSLCKAGFSCPAAFLSHCQARHEDLGAVRRVSNRVLQLCGTSGMSTARESFSGLKDWNNPKSIFHKHHWCCCQCVDAFNSLEDLHQHSLEKHPGSRMLLCKHCDFFTMVEEEIVDHVDVHSSFADSAGSHEFESDVADTGDFELVRVKGPALSARKTIRSGNRLIPNQASPRPSLHGSSCSETKYSPPSLDDSTDDILLHIKKELSTPQLSCKFCDYTCDDLESLDGHLANFHKIVKNLKLAVPELEADLKCRKTELKSSPTESSDAVVLSDSDEDLESADTPNTSRHGFRGYVTNLTCPYCGFESYSTSQYNVHIERHAP